MGLLNFERKYIHAPTMNPAHTAVFGLKMHPPANFNLQLHSLATAHGVSIHNIGFHPHATGIKLSVDFSGPLDNAKRFVENAKSKFSAYVSGAEARFGARLK